jgi:DNA-binding SARP family transcriptional activator/TolB-like protein
MHLPVISLKALGTTDLRAPDRPGAALVLAQPKRLALLLYLALAGRGSFLRRDTILALFWPEADQTRGRQALRQTIYLLRQSLGRDAILSRGDEELAINPEQIQCDAVLFERALAAGQSAEALEHYRGDLLTGFHVPDAAPELEEWIERERRRLRDQAMTAAWTLAGQEERGGNAAGVSYWARRAVEFSPNDEQGVRNLMAILRRVGDRPGALRAYEEYARRVQEELGIRPSADLRQAADELRRHSVPPAAAARDAASGAALPLASPPVPPPPAAPEAVPPADSAGHPTVAVATRPRERWRSARRIVIVAGLGVILVGGMLRLLRSPAPGAPVLAVGDIREMGGRDSSAAPAVAELLVSSLARIEGLQVVSGARLLELEGRLGPAGGAPASALEAAKAGGATLLVRGDLTPTEDRGERLELQVIDVASGRIRRTLTAEGGEPFAVTREAAAAVARALGVPVPRVDTDSSSTPSLAALRFYTEGLRSFYQDADYSAARRLFLAALDQDSTFAMAALMASQSDELVTNHPPSPLLERAVRLAPRASDRDRLLIQTIAAGHQFDPAAIAIAETLAVRYPTEPVGHLLLAQAALTYGHFETAIRSALHVIAMDSLGLERQQPLCRACEAYTVLATAYLQQNRIDQADSVARDFMARWPGNVTALGLVNLILLRTDRFEEASHLSARIDSLAGRQNFTPSEVDAPLRAADFEGVDQILEQLAVRGTPGEQEDARWWLAISLRTQGRLQQATDLLSRGRTPTGRTLVVRSLPDTMQLAQVLCESGHPREGAATFRRIADRARGQWRVSHHAAKHRAWHLTHAATCLDLAGDTAVLRPLADTIQAVGGASSWERDRHLHYYVRGLLLRKEGRTEEAIAAFLRALTAPAEGFTRINYDLAGALLEVGRPREAIEPLQAALRAPLEAGGLYLTRTETEERLAVAFERAGKLDSARVHFGWVARAWSHADPPFHERWLEAVAHAEKR